MISPAWISSGFLRCHMSDITPSLQPYTHSQNYFLHFSSWEFHPLLWETQEPHFLLTPHVCVIKYTQLYLQCATVISQCIILDHSVTGTSLGHPCSKYLLPLAKIIASCPTKTKILALLVCPQPCNPSHAVPTCQMTSLLHLPRSAHITYLCLRDEGLIMMHKMIMILNASPMAS